MKYYIIVFALFLCVSICGTTLLWRINVNPPAYILGTVHLPYTYIWPSLSSTAKSAFNNSTHFLPEFDVTNFFSFTQFRMCISANMLPVQNNLPQPGFMGQHGPQSPILDIYLTLQARRMGKNVQSSESVEMYCEFTKFQAESLTKNFGSNPAKPLLPNDKENDEVKRAYNCDLNTREEFFQPTTTNVGDPALFAFKQRLDEVCRRRDLKTAQKIHSLLKDALPSNRFFFALGFVHMMSPTGIIARLRQDYNYSVTRLCSDPPDFRTQLGCQGPSWCDPIAGL